MLKSIGRLGQTRSVIGLACKFAFGALLTTSCGALELRSPKPVEYDASKATSSYEPSRTSSRTPLVEVQDLEPLPTLEPPRARVAKNLRIPIELNAHVEKWIRYFTVQDRERFQRFLMRGQNYRDVVETVLEDNDLPAELYYLAMIESGYQTHAQSHAKAVGAWQFIAGTGQRYGLRIDRFVDERKDPIRATEAAAKYLRDLYNVFGSWHLAMAAYNAGEVRVLRAVMKGRTRNFWELVESNALPRETANYVPKFLAVVMIGKNPEKYGFSLPKSKDPYPSLKTIEVPGSLSLAAIAERSGLPLNVLSRVNPHLHSARTPPGSSSYEIWVPETHFSKVERVRPQLATVAKANRKVASAASVSKTARSERFHVVKRGESLTLIARKYNVSLGHLMRINGLKSDHIEAGLRLHTHAKVYATSKFIRYKVRRGDNLTIIARKFNTSVRKIRHGNQLKKNRVLIGQYLRIEAGH